MTQNQQQYQIISLAMMKLFRTLCLLLQKYSQLSISKLFNRSLTLDILYPFDYKFVQMFKGFSPQQLSIVNKNKSMIMIVINHDQHYLNNVKDFLLLEQCIIVDDTGKQLNNLLLSVKKQQSQRITKIKGIILGFDTKIKRTQLQQELNWFLSIIELFHNHINLKLFLYEPFNWSSIAFLLYEKQLEDWEEDHLQSLPENAFVKILEERGSKISDEQLGQICEVRRQYWGQLYKIEQGTQGLIIWITKNRLPSLMVPNTILPSFHKIKESQIGYCIFGGKRRKKQKLEQSAYTIYIINIDPLIAHKEQQLNKILNIQLKSIEQDYKKIVGNANKIEMTFQYIFHIQRLSELLELDSSHLYKKIFFENKKKLC